MSNLLKGMFVAPPPKEKFVIDSNQLVAERMRELRNSLHDADVDPDGFSAGLDAERVELLVDGGQDLSLIHI